MIVMASWKVLSRCKNVSLKSSEICSFVLSLWIPFCVIYIGASLSVVCCEESASLTIRVMLAKYYGNAQRFLQMKPRPLKAPDTRYQEKGLALRWTKGIRPLLWCILIQIKNRYIQAWIYSRDYMRKRQTLVNDMKT